MKTHTTNYRDTFIEVAEDCPVSSAAAPPPKSPKTIAEIQFEMLSQNPYKYSSDDIVFRCHAEKKELTETEMSAAKQEFFSKGQACLRSSPLAKRYGYGFHHDKDGKVALFAVNSEEYDKFLRDSSVKKVKTMRSRKA